MPSTRSTYAPLTPPDHVCTRSRYVTPACIGTSSDERSPPHAGPESSLHAMIRPASPISWHEDTANTVSTVSCGGLSHSDTRYTPGSDGVYVKNTPDFTLA